MSVHTAARLSIPDQMVNNQPSSLLSLKFHVIYGTHHFSDGPIIQLA